MPQHSTARDENSVATALKGLMGLEEDRQRGEEQKRLEREATARRLAEEALRREQEEETHKRREAITARLAEERRAAEAAERRQRENREQEIRIRAETEARVHAQQQERMLAFELEMKRISSQRRGIPGWTMGLAVVVFLAIGGIGVAIHLRIAATYKQRINDLQAKVAKLETTAATAAGQADARLNEATRRATTAERRINELQGTISGLRDQVQSLTTAKPGRRPRLGPKAPRSSDRSDNDTNRGVIPALTDDPLDSSLRID